MTASVVQRASYPNWVFIRAFAAKLWLRVA
jgi:hypothetical protein